MRPRASARARRRGRPALAELAPSSCVRQLEPARRLDVQHLRLLALLDRDRVDARRSPRSRSTASVVDAEGLDLDDRPVGDARFQLARRPLGDDPPASRSRRSGRRARPPRTCSASSAARSCRPCAARRSSRAARARRPGRRRSSARRGTPPAGRGGSRGRCAAAGACRASSPRPARCSRPSSPTSSSSSSIRRFWRLPGTPYSSAK